MGEAIGSTATSDAVSAFPAVLRWTPLPLLAVLLVAAMLLAAGVGAVHLAPGQTVTILFGWIGLALPIEYTAQQEAVLLAIRLPRVLLAALVGGGLAIAGATLQGVFRNPLADPGLIGVSGGAALGAVSVIVLGLRPFGLYTLPLAAFGGGLLTTLLVYRLARRGGRTEVTTLLLVGLALNALLGALTSFFTFLATDPQLRSIVFWLMGGLGTATWRALTMVAPFLLIGTLLLPRFARALNLLALGETEAGHLGVETERLRWMTITLAALATGASVAVTGIIGFVGLVTPHLLRLALGPDHRLLLPASALGGATLLVLADLVARTVVRPAELPLGIVTAAAGAPFFLYLIYRTREQQGGWG
ncbi:MAG: iron ABC transporter permease [Chloroflexi bacterium]|nr:iron ABC transporter permease [Chloroflexota bacterium]